VRADAAAVFAAELELGFRRTLLAAEAARTDVCSLRGLVAMMISFDGGLITTGDDD
jgi:hypothetical protein